MADGLKLHTMLAQQRLILLEPVDEVSLLRFLLPPTGRLWRNDLAVYASLDTVGTRLVLITSDLPLLTKDAAVAPCQLDGSLM